MTQFKAEMFMALWKENSIKQKKKTRFRNLIDMRGNFVPELSRSMNKL